MKTFLTLSFALITFYSYAVDAIRIKIKGNSYSDETVIRFLENAKNELDKEYDVFKLFSPNPEVPSIYTMVDTITKLSINSLPPLTRSIYIPLYFKMALSGPYTIGIEEFGTIPPQAQILLVNSDGQYSYNLRNGRELTFDYETFQKSKSPFKLHIFIPSTVKIIETLTQTNPSMGVSIFKSGDEPWRYYLCDTLGNVFNASSEVEPHITISNIEPGDYKLFVYNVSGVIETFEIKIPYYSPLGEQEHERNDENYIVYPNPSNGKIFLSNHSGYSENTEVQIINAKGLLEYTKTFQLSDDIASTECLDLEALPRGAYFLKIIVGDTLHWKKIIIQ